MCDGIDFSSQMSRARLEGLASSFINEVVALSNEAVSKAGLTNKDVNKVIVIKRRYIRISS